MKKLVIITAVFVILLTAAGVMLFEQMKGNGSLLSQKNTPTRATSQLANPASVNCEKLGGTLEIKENGSGGQYGLCMFEDNMACEEWALYRGECPVGGIKTTGYDNIQQMYCAWSGGKTLAVKNATCTLHSGEVCPVDAFYNGTCPKNTITDPNQGS